jgi:transcriptional regulator with XRE-family HTH domain
VSTIGARLRAARRARALTLADVAGKRLSVSLVSKIERDLVRPSLPTLEHLAERLGTTASALLGTADGGSAGLALARAEAALAAGEPEEALLACRADPSPAAGALRAAALVELDRDDEAIAEVDAAGRAGPLPPPVGARLELARGRVLAGRGLTDAAQEAFARALRLLRDDQRDARAEVLLGMARLAERVGQRSTARSFFAQALADLSAAASPVRRAEALRRRAAAAEAAGDPVAAAAALVAAVEVASLAAAVQARAETATRLAELELASGRPEQALQRYREASDSMPHRAVRHPRPT